MNSRNVVDNSDLRKCLFDAIIEQNLVEAERLIQQGADVNGRDSLGNNSFVYAVLNSTHEIAQRMIELGASVPDIFPFEEAILNENPGMLSYLLSMGADINQIDSDGETPLMRAVREEALDIVQFLIAKGADANAISASGNTALDIAFQQSNQQIIDFLKQKR